MQWFKIIFFRKYDQHEGWSLNAMVRNQFLENMINTRVDPWMPWFEINFYKIWSTRGLIFECHGSKSIFRKYDQHEGWSLNAMVRNQFLENMINTRVIFECHGSKSIFRKYDQHEGWSLNATVRNQFLKNMINTRVDLWMPWFEINF